VPDVYDKEKQDTGYSPREHDDLGVDPERRDAEEPDLKSAEESGSTRAGKGKSEKEELDKLGAGYRNEEDSKGRLGGLKNRFMKSGKRKQYAMVASALGGLGLLGTLIVLVFNLLGIFKLDHFMNNIESKAFIRYQVDMEGRSSKWINAYMQLRLMDIDDPNRPNNPDNIMFRSNRVDTNNPVTDWYKTMRASKFEADLAEKYGMKFTSVAYKDGNITKFRPGIVSIRGEGDLTFNPNETEIRNIENFDPNGLNGRLREFVDVKVFDSNKAGRQELKRVIRENTKSWQFTKRYYVRKSIQNMTGIRDWRFFENTRDNVSEKKISMRNRILQKALPESTKSGKLVQCLFGLIPCKSQPDPNDPQNHAEIAPNGALCDSSKPECTRDADGDPKTQDGITNDNSAVTDIAAGAAEDVLSDTQAQVIQKVTSTLTKASGPAAIISLLDTLDTVDASIKSGALITTIYMAKATQDIGLYTTYGIAKDQIHTGEVNGREVNDMMQMLDGVGTSEGYDTVVAGNNKRKQVSAQGMEAAQSKKEYCSEDHQAAMLLPENKKVAEAEYHYLCPQEKIGGPNRAQDITDGWNNSIGAILQPILTPYRNSGPLKDLVGIFNSTVEAIMSHTITPLLNGALKALGFADNMKDFVGWLVGRVATFLGAIPTYSVASPTGVYSNHVLTGASASSEFAMRFSGGAATDSLSQADSEKRVAQYLSEKRGTESMFDKYASTSNPDSVLSKNLFAVSSRSFGSSVSHYLGSVFSAPFVTTPTKAATQTGYEAARFAGVDTYDMPKECTDSDPISTMFNGALTKQTNADDLGLIPASELTWELLRDSNAFYARLYELHPDSKEINNAYDCAVFDSMAMGSVAGRYAPNQAGPNAIVNNNSGQSNQTDSGAGASFRIATFNVQGASHTGGDFEARLQKSIDVINNNSADIVGFQEFQEPQRASFLNKERGTYDIYPKAAEYGGGSGHASENSIIWDKNKFSLVSGGYMPNLKYFNGTPLKAPYVKLQTTSGQQFYVLNTHDPADAGCDCAKIRYDNANEHVKFIQSLQDEKLPVFLTGDFNSGYSLGNEQRHRNNPTYQNDADNLTYCILGRSKLTNDAFDVANNRTFKCPNDGNDNSVDHIYLSAGLNVTKYFKVGNNGSDVHDTHFADIVVPGSSGDSGTVLPAACYTVTKQRGNITEGRMFHKADGIPINTYAKENSPQGVRYAAEHNYDSIDLDVQITKDGVPVNTHWGQPMMRDGFFDPQHQIPEGTQVNEMTLAEVTRLRNRDGQSQIHSLEDMIKILAENHINLSLELKTGAIAAKFPQITGALNQYKVKAYMKGDASRAAINKALTAARNFGYWTRGTEGTQDWKAPGPSCQ
jgi:endonuclease/exonuclease/phosphatase family metal-dependent hydrolase